MSKYIEHYAYRFRPIALILHFRIGYNYRKVGLVPRMKHTQQAGLAYDVAIEVCYREPGRVSRSMVYVDAGLYLFLVSGLLKAALKHDLRLIEPIGKIWCILFPLLTQNYTFAPYLPTHMSLFVPLPYRLLGNHSTIK